MPPYLINWQLWEQLTEIERFHKMKLKNQCDCSHEHYKVLKTLSKHIQ